MTTNPHAAPTIDDVPERNHSEAEISKDAKIALEELEHLQKELAEFEDRIRQGDLLTPEDQLRIQRLLVFQVEPITNALENVVIGEEPEIVGLLRELQIGSSVALLFAAGRLSEGRYLLPGPYRNYSAELAWAFAVHELLEEHGAVAVKEDRDGDLDVDELRSVIEAVEEAEDVVIDHGES